MAFSRRARRIFLRARFLFCLFVCAFIFGCSRHELPADITIINNVEPESLDPAIITGQADGRVVQGLFAGLTRLDPKTARPAPDLAERWEISQDGLIYTFHLRTNLVWKISQCSARSGAGLAV